jgi:hypothetical protein
MKFSRSEANGVSGFRVKDKRVICFQANAEGPTFKKELLLVPGKSPNGNQVTPAPVGRTTAGRWRDGGRRVNGTVLIAVLPVGKL